MQCVPRGPGREQTVDAKEIRLDFAFLSPQALAGLPLVPSDGDDAANRMDEAELAALDKAFVYYGVKV